MVRVKGSARSNQPWSRPTSASSWAKPHGPERSRQRARVSWGRGWTSTGSACGIEATSRISERAPDLVGPPVAARGRGPATDFQVGARRPTRAAAGAATPHPTQRDPTALPPHPRLSHPPSAGPTLARREDDWEPAASDLAVRRDELIAGWQSGGRP